MAAVQAMSPNARAEALEHYMIEQLNSSAGSTDEAEDNVKLDFYDPERPVPRGAGTALRREQELEADASRTDRSSSV